VSAKLRYPRPGWDESGYGGKRYWDRERWTGHRRARGAGERRASQTRRRKKGLVALGLLFIVFASLVGGRPNKRPPLDTDMSRNLKPIHEHPRHGRLGQPLMLSRGDLKLVITPTRLLDPLDVGAADLAVGGHDSRFVGLEVRTTNVGQESYRLSAEDVKLLTAQNNAALSTDRVKTGDCLSEPGADLDPIAPASTTTECYPFEVERSEGLKEMRMVVTDGAGTATGIWRFD
jgi:hypothetical protein